MLQTPSSPFSLQMHSSQTQNASLPTPSNPQGLFRLAAGASVLRKLKSSLASGSNALEEFYSDPHAVAGECQQGRVGDMTGQSLPSLSCHQLHCCPSPPRCTEVLPAGAAPAFDDIRTL